MEPDAPLAGPEAILVCAGELANVGTGIAFGEAFDCLDDALGDLAIQSLDPELALDLVVRDEGSALREFVAGLLNCGLLLG